ncbi:signal recognition particle protein [candidate division KSB1 bacterium]|nr:signal recognition particle protein [candidate division KSB1 bacterium]MBL7093290.1 signal recognition particle protein [candidate division KSB1 bacterium]
MFQDLSEKLEVVIKKLKGHGKLSEKNISDSLKEVRRVLLEADVNFKVAKAFIASVQEQALGKKVLRSITPGQQIVKIIHDELSKLMGEKEATLNVTGALPTVIMLTGLQGSGKTTLAGKLGLYFKDRGHKPVLAAADIYRPAAVKQLEIVGEQIGVPVIHEDSKSAAKICLKAMDYCRKHGSDLVIFDTAGRLHIDGTLMNELLEIKKKTQPHEILFVADSMTGQDAVNTAKEFLNWLDFDGVVLTKMDGDARGGAALSIRTVTEKPIKFISTGEKFDALEKFHPERMASRILGMGDVVTLVEKAQQAVDQEQAEKLEKKLRRQQFTLKDFYDQLQQIKKMGPLDQLMGMIPGAQKGMMKGMQLDDTAFVGVEAIINSMTPGERQRPQIIDGSRRRRIAKGSGKSVQDVNQLLKQFKMMQKMMKNVNKIGLKGLPIGF